MFSAKKKALRLASLILVVFLTFSLLAPVAQARASLYIFSYSATIHTEGNGKVSVWFDITGTGTMEEIGAKTVTIYENNKSVFTYSFLADPSMMSYNKAFHCSSVTYSGVAGRSYYAVVSFWAAKQGGGDGRSVTTSSIIAV